MSAQREVCSRVLSAAKESYGTDFRNSMAFNNSYDNGFVHGKTKDDTFSIYLRRKTERNQRQRQGINAGEDKSKIWAKLLLPPSLGLDKLSSYACHTHTHTRILRVIQATTRRVGNPYTHTRIQRRRQQLPMGELCLRSCWLEVYHFNGCHICWVELPFPFTICEYLLFTCRRRWFRCCCFQIGNMSWQARRRKVICEQIMINWNCVVAASPCRHCTSICANTKSVRKGRKNGRSSTSSQ